MHRAAELIARWAYQDGLKIFDQLANIRSIDGDKCTGADEATRHNFDTGLIRMAKRLTYGVAAIKNTPFSGFKPPGSLAEFRLKTIAKIQVVFKNQS